MSTPTDRKLVSHLIRNTRNKDQNSNIIVNIDQIEPKLDQLITAVGHTVIDISNSTTVAGGATHLFPVVDISPGNGIFEFEIAGTLGATNMDFSLEVSQNNIDWFPFPTIFTKINSNLSATFDMVFRYHRISVTNNTGISHTVDYIQSGRH